jgi:hypothetical protein
MPGISSMASHEFCFSQRDQSRKKLNEKYFCPSANENIYLNSKMEWQCLTIRASVSHQTEVRYQLIVSSPSSERNNTVPCFYWAQKPKMGTKIKNGHKNKQYGNSVR